MKFNRKQGFKFPLIKDAYVFTNHSEIFNYNKSFDKITLRFDGACEPINPNGDIGLGWALFDSEDDVIAHGWGYLFQDDKWQTSNNIAEWASLYFGACFLLESGISYQKLEIIGDSMFVIRQLNGDWRINADKAYSSIAIDFMENVEPYLPKYNAFWQGRDNNEYCDTLSNKFREYNHGI